MRLMRDTELVDYVRRHIGELAGRQVNVMSYNKEMAKQAALCFYRDEVLSGRDFVHRWVYHYPYHVKVRRQEDHDYVDVYFRTFTSSKNCSATSSHFFIPNDVYDRVRKRFDLSYSDMNNDDSVLISWFIQNVYFKRVKKQRGKKYTRDEIDEFLDSFDIY